MNNRYKVILIRHGQSIWNHDSKFTGWTNIPLTNKGRNEAREIAETLKKNNIIPDVYFSSVLNRAIETADIIKARLNNNSNMYTSWRLNEKHYGSLEGVPRNYMREEYGEKFTQMMRNNFYMKPPVLTNIPNNNEYSIFKNCYYDSIQFGESKENVLSRLLPYFQNDILHSLYEDKLPIIVTHKHCMRVLMKHYLNITDTKFEKYTIPNRTILIMYFDKKYKYTDYHYIQY